MCCEYKKIINLSIINIANITLHYITINTVCLSAWLAVLYNAHRPTIVLFFSIFCINWLFYFHHHGEGDNGGRSRQCMYSFVYGITQNMSMTHSIVSGESCLYIHRNHIHHTVVTAVKSYFMW